MFFSCVAKALINFDMHYFTSLNKIHIYGKHLKFHFDLYISMQYQKMIHAFMDILMFDIIFLVLQKAHVHSMLCTHYSMDYEYVSAGSNSRMSHRK